MQPSRSNHLRYLQFRSAVGVGRSHHNHRYSTESYYHSFRKGLSFHTVSFGPDTSSHSLRRMAQIAEEVYRRAPNDPLAPAVQDSCKYTRAIDTVSISWFLTCFTEGPMNSDSSGGNVFAYCELIEGKEGRPETHLKLLCPLCFFFEYSVPNQSHPCCSTFLTPINELRLF